jgi:hypothetical protein
VRFELTVPGSPVRRFSRPVPSTTRPPIQVIPVGKLNLLQHPSTSGFWAHSRTHSRRYWPSMLTIRANTSPGARIEARRQRPQEIRRVQWNDWKQRQQVADCRGCHASVALTLDEVTTSVSTSRVGRCGTTEPLTSSSARHTSCAGVRDTASDRSRCRRRRRGVGGRRVTTPAQSAIPTAARAYRFLATLVIDSPVPVLRRGRHGPCHPPAGGCQSSTLFPSGSTTQPNFPKSDSSIFSSTLHPSSRNALSRPWRSATR